MKSITFRASLKALACALSTALLAPSCTTVNEHYYPVPTPPPPAAPKKTPTPPKKTAAQPVPTPPPPPMRNPEGFTAVSPYGGTPAGKGASSPDVERNQRSKTEKFETSTNLDSGARKNN